MPPRDTEDSRRPRAHKRRHDATVRLQSGFVKLCATCYDAQLRAEGYGFRVARSKRGAEMVSRVVFARMGTRGPIKPYRTPATAHSR